MGWPAYLRIVVRGIVANLGLLVFVGLLMVTRAGIRAGIEHPRTYLIGVAFDLATAWIVIAVITSVIRNPFVNRLVTISTWTIAALSILRLLDPVAEALDSAAIVIGGLRLTPLLVLKTTALMLVALWVAGAASTFLDRSVKNVQGLTPSIQVLIGKVIHFTLIALAVLVVLNSVGIDLTALAWFSGAIGVGLGFGLQKIVSNLVSGIILLADRSVKPGDVVTIGDNFGWVSTIGARYTSIDLKDGRELLVPNEDLITQKVINWSYSATVMQLQIKFSATYDSDMRKTQAAAMEAARSVEQVMKEPAPSCHVTGFGTTAIEYVLWCWIGDAVTGPTRTRSAVLLALWDTFEREGITIPKPGATHVVLEQPPPKPEQALQK